MTIVNRDATITVEKTGAEAEAPVKAETEATVYIIIAVAVSICGGGVAWLVISKKKQKPSAEK